MNQILNLFKKDFYERIGGLSPFRGMIVLDIGCGDGEDSLAISRFAKKVTGIDVVEDKKWDKIKNRKLNFVVGDAQRLPFEKNRFNGVFLKDVLHHVTDPERVLKEIKRVAVKGPLIILIEGNRYNPLFYIHMTKLGGHDHLKQGQFKELILKYFPNAQFVHFESHFIPFINKSLFMLIIEVEKFVDRIDFLRPILSYNASIIKG